MSTKRWLAVGFAFTMLVASFPASTQAADESKAKAATRQVETGAKKIGDGKVGTGAEEMAKGVGNTVVEGAKFTGEKFKESGQAASPPAKSAWQHLKEGSVKQSADAFGSSVKNFFTRLFTN
jgi:hypothetical protein